MAGDRESGCKGKQTVIIEIDFVEKTCFAEKRTEKRRDPKAERFRCDPEDTTFLPAFITPKNERNVWVEPCERRFHTPNRREDPAGCVLF